PMIAIAELKATLPHAHPHVEHDEHLSGHTLAAEEPAPAE
ncbi:MAG: hypothetical protein ACI9KE_003965, partial [Polyangiales bacterium]